MAALRDSGRGRVEREGLPGPLSWFPAQQLGQKRPVSGSENCHLIFPVAGQPLPCGQANFASLVFTLQGQLQWGWLGCPEAAVKPKPATSSQASTEGLG